MLASTVHDSGYASQSVAANTYCTLPSYNEAGVCLTGASSGPAGQRDALLECARHPFTLLATAVMLHLQS